MTGYLDEKRENQIVPTDKIKKIINYIVELGFGDDVQLVREKKNQNFFCFKY